MDYKCDTCSFAGPSRAAVRYHVATSHIDVVDVFLDENNTRKVTVKRIGGVFTCVCGGFTKSSMWFLRHRPCYLKEQQQSRTETCDPAIEEESSELQTAPVGEYDEATTSQHMDLDTGVTDDRQELTFLKKFNLAYREEYNLLVCLHCKCALGISFASHARKQHCISIPREDEKKIKAACFVEESPYFQCNQTLLPPLDFLPVLDGFRCGTCNYYGKVQKRVIEHARAVHHNDQVVLCKVQTISTSNCVKYFGVQDVPVCQTSCSRAPELSRVVKKVMSSVLSESSRAPEPVEQRNIFYVVMGWYPEPEAVDKYHCVDKMELLSVPQVESDEYYHEFLCIRTIFEESLKGVSFHEYPFRLAVNAGVHECKPLCSPQCEATTKTYGLVFTHLIFFVCNLTTKGPSQFQQPQCVTEACRELLLQPNKKSLFDLVRLLLEGRVIDNDSGAPIPLFIRFRCLLKDGSLLSPERVSCLCAQVIYVMKLSVLEIVKAETGDQNKEIKIKELLPLIKVEPGNFNVFSFVCRVKALAKHANLHSNRLPLIVQLSNDPFDIIVRGVGLQAEQLRVVYRRALDRCHFLVQQLLLGLNTSIENPHDTLHGSRIMANKNNHRDEAIRCSLLTHVLSSHSKIVHSISDEMDVVYHSSEASAYLQTYTEYLQNMLMVIHIGSGMPARSTEIETYRLQDGRSNKRNVFYMGKNVCFHAEYSKSRSVRAANRPISRFLDEEASCLLLKDILVVRPFLCTIASFLGINEDNVYGTDFFVVDGSRMKGEQLRNVFVRLFFDYCGAAISFGDYRHVAKYYILQLKIRYPIRMPDDENDSDEEATAMPLATNDEQFGHSSATSNVYYGRHGGELGITREHILHNFFSLSAQWHNFIRGEGTRCAERRNDRVVQEVPSISVPSHPVCAPLPACSTSSTVQISAVQENVPTQMLHGLNFVTVQQAKDSVVQLRALYKDETVEFKSRELRAAVDNVLHSKSDMLVILPTGAGKSLLFLLYAVKHPTLTSIVVVPTISLRCDLLRRARSLGILCSDDAEKMNGVRLVFVTPEAAAGEAVRDQIIHLYSRKQLGAIFLDEAHLFSTQSQFRPTFRQLPELKCIPVPLVLLTATAPQWIVADLVSNFFGPKRTPVVVRQSTDRWNISYSVSLNLGVENVANRIKTQVHSYAQEDRGIIYVPAVDMITAMQGELRKKGVPCAVYCGQYKDEENVENFSAWREGKAVIMVATSAFGQGIDYPSIRNVDLFGLPYSLEEYSQQCGRAGRDAKPSSACLIFTPRHEESKLHYLQEGEREAFKCLLKYAVTKDVCRRRFLSRYLDGTEIECSYVDCQKCDVCTTEEEYDGMDVPESFFDGESSEEETSDVTHAHSLISERRNLGSTLLHFLKIYEKQCIICNVANGTNVSHHGNACPTTYGLCFRCFGNHRRCSQEVRTIRGTCPHCFLPQKIGDTFFHTRGFTIDCIGKDVLKFFALAALKFGIIPLSKREWIYNVNQQGMLNLWHAFVNHCKSAE